MSPGAAMRCIAALLLCASLPAAAAARLALTPLALTLNGGQRATSLTVGNQGTGEVTIEADVLAWSQDDGDERTEPSRELLVSPPIFTIAPGASQLLRIGRAELANAPAVERAFRLRLTEVPPADLQQRGQITTLMRMTLPIFLPPADRRALPALTVAPAQRSGDDLVLKIDNGGAVHGKLTGLQLLQNGRVLAEQNLNWYLLAGAHRELRWPAALKTAAPGDAILRARLPGRDRQIEQPLRIEASKNANASPSVAQ